jgi:hypothetical protein
MSTEAFAPVDGASKHITIAATTASVLVWEGNGGAYVPVRIQNQGTATAWIRAGDSTVVATTSGIPVGAGVTEVLRFQVPIGHSRLYIAAIAAAATGIISFTPGDGI